MTFEFLERTEALLGKDKLDTFINSKIAVFGVGGVGGACVEALIRTGLSNILVVDFDKVDITNLNRQIISNIENVGNYKVDAIEKRILSINPNVIIKKSKKKLTPSNLDTFSLKDYDYVVDAIDDIEAKVALIKYCSDKNIKIISAMGTGKRIDPLKLKVADIYKTEGCPLARKMRKRLKNECVKKLKVVYSNESPKGEKSTVIPSISYLPSISGMIISSEVIKDLINI